MSALELPPQMSLHAECPVGWALVQYDQSASSVAVRGKIAGMEFDTKDQVSSMLPAAMSIIPVLKKLLARFESTGDAAGEGIDVHLTAMVNGQEIQTQVVRVPLRVGPLQQITAFNTVIDAMRKKMKT